MNSPASFGRQIGQRLYASGQPTAQQIAELPAIGFDRIIDLRPASEDRGFDEPSAVTAANIQYLSLPIASEADLTSAVVGQLDQWLCEPTEGNTLIHCGTSNRVGALVALRAAWHQGSSVENALRLGRLAGLMGLEAAVINILERHRG